MSNPHLSRRRGPRALVLTGALTLVATAFTAAFTPVSASASSPVSYAVNGKAITTSLSSAINRLPVAAENGSGYVRSKFTLWTDANRNCRNTRAEVLVAESRTKTTGGCTIRTGRWRDWYDNTTYTSASQLDIDHLVPLAEAWASGARNWSAGRREAYANDLADSHTLVAVSLHANRQKGDSEPDEWMPIHHPCRYIASWVIVKTRWGLVIDSAEKADLLQMASYCGNPTIRTHTAVVKTSGSSGSTSGSTGGSTGGVTSPPPASAGLDPQFGTCTEAKAHGYGPYYVGTDPEYYWYEDRDHDGIVCE